MDLDSAMRVAEEGKKLFILAKGQAPALGTGGCFLKVALLFWVLFANFRF